MTAHEAAYQHEIRALSDETREHACELVDFLVSQPPKREAVMRTLDFAWWCLGRGAAHAHVVTERESRELRARHGDETAKER